MWKVHECNPNDNGIVHSETVIYDVQDSNTWSQIESAASSNNEITTLCATNLPELCLYLTDDSPPRLTILSLNEYVFDFSNDTQWLRTYLIQYVAADIIADIDDGNISESIPPQRRLLSDSRFKRKEQRMIRREATHEMMKINRDLQNHKIRGNGKAKAYGRILSLENKRNGLLNPYSKKKKHRNPWRKYNRPLSRGPEGPRGDTGRVGLRGPAGRSGIPGFAKVLPQIERAVEGIYYHRRTNGKPRGMSKRMHHMQRRVDYILCNVIPGKRKCARNGNRGSGRSAIRNSRTQQQDERSGNIDGVGSMLKRNRQRMEHQEQRTRRVIRTQRTERRRKLVEEMDFPLDRVEMCGVIPHMMESICVRIGDGGHISVEVTKWEGIKDREQLEMWIGHRDGIKGEWMVFGDECNGNFLDFGIDSICVQSDMVNVITKNGEMAFNLMNGTEWNRIWNVNRNERVMCRDVADSELCVAVQLLDTNEIAHVHQISVIELQ